MAASIRRAVLKACSVPANVSILCREHQLTCSVRSLSASQRWMSRVSPICHQQDSMPEPTPLPVADTREATLNATLQHEDYFGVKDLANLRDLFNARVHLGHNSGLRHPSMSPYIFGSRQGCDMIDLDQTLPLLCQALNVTGHVVYRGGMLLFLSRQTQVLPWVERLAREVGEYSHCRPWRTGTFTNASSLFGTLPIYPELCIFLGTQDTVFETHRGVIEASKLLIPTVGVVDTNCDAEPITYPVPGNDDSPAALHFYMGLFRSVVLRAKARRKADGVE
ncbi:hypothetical protein EGW08_004697 [Elysia chlorotica]|uniref:Ribosomal protein S2 n=1 Tax=Elysia chlorotica TaxID=188477 RepID=A0A3S1CAL5_ELYCH|nr:hypothetical protein EGW08_004697 [Elysia chlorotica]